MSTGKASDFKIYEAEFYGGMWEGLSQNVAAFNEASANAMVLTARDLRGNYAKESFFKSISGLISRRDTTSVSTTNDLAMTQDEFVSAKVNRKIGPVAQTLDAWKKLGKDAQEMSFVLGGMIAEEKMKDFVNTAALGVEAAIEGQTDFNYDATGQSTATLTHGHLVKGLAKMGDMAQGVVAWVMHSKPYFDLVGQAISDKIYGVADQMVIYGGIPATLGRPVIVIDANALHDDNASADDTYNVLGLTRAAVSVEESENQDIIFEPVTGLENIVYRLQGEYAFNLGCKGFKWNVSGGGSNPTDASIGTASNWTLAVSSGKLSAGVRVKVK